MKDTAYDEFISKFSTGNEVQPQQRNISQYTDIGKGLDLAPAEVDGLTGEAMTAGSISPLRKTPKAGFDFGGAGLLALGALPDAMTLYSNATGGQFDTSAEGGGVGKATGSIISGAATGAKMGTALGPVGTAVGAVVGGGISALAHRDAKKEYVNNRKKLNVSEDALERAQSQQDYRRSEGLASLADLKSLREKQLGIIS